MREYTEQEKDKKIKREKNGEFEKEFQPEKKLEKKDEIGNDFIPIADNPNNTGKFDNGFEPLDDLELNPKSSSRKNQREIQNVKSKKKKI